jgi:ankyrin repeat protein
VATSDPAIVPAVRRSQPALVHRASTSAAVGLLKEFGFDVNAAVQGVTALHDAAFTGNIMLIEALLGAGADPARFDDEHHATPLGWARYACQPEAVEVLTAVTPD